MASKSTAHSLTISGPRTQLPLSVQLSPGWTFLPFPYQAPLAVTLGLPDYDYPAGASLKSQTDFTEYYAGYGWFGSLTSMVPGKGYKVKVNLDQPTGGQATFLAR